MPKDAKFPCNYCGNFKEMKVLEDLAWYDGFICKKCFKANQEEEEST